MAWQTAAARRSQAAGTGLSVAIGFLAIGFLAGGAIALAQTAAFDSDQLPVFTGKVAFYDLTPRGDIDGLILEDGTQVHFPPALGAQLVAIARPGDRVTIHGIKARVLRLVAASSIENDATHRKAVDPGPDRYGPPEVPGAPAMREAGGKIKLQLYGPRGELNGVMLEDGTQIHLQPPEAERLGAQLASGLTIFVRGYGTVSVLGRSIEAHAIGPSAATLAQVDAPPPPGRRPPPPPPGPPPPPPG